MPNNFMNNHPLKIVITDTITKKELTFDAFAKSWIQNSTEEYLRIEPGIVKVPYNNGRLTLQTVLRITDLRIVKE